MILSRQSLGDPPAAPPPPPPPRPFGLGPYQSTPLLNQRSPLLGLTITFIVVSWICCILRLYIRFFVKRAPGWDDFFIILTMISTTIGSVVLCVMTDMGLGKPIFALSLAELQRILKFIYIGTATYPLSASLIKIALLLQYLDIFHGLRIRLLCKIMLVVSALAGLAFGICTWFSCFPVSAFWDFTIPGAYCWGFASQNKLEFMRIMVTQVVMAAFLDLIVYLIPVWLFFQPETQMTTKLSLVGLLVLGFAAILCAIWRVVYVVQLQGRESGFDPIWDDPTVMALVSYEIHLAAVCAALPVFWPAVKATWNRTWNHIFVTYTVSVTQEYGGVFPSRPRKELDIELQQQSSASDRNLILNGMTPQQQQMELGWEPFVGDETTGLGENETVVEVLHGAAGKQPRGKGILGRG